MLDQNPIISLITALFYSSNHCFELSDSIFAPVSCQKVAISHTIHTSKKIDLTSPLTPMSIKKMKRY